MLSRTIDWNTKKNMRSMRHITTLKGLPKYIFTVFLHRYFSRILDRWYWWKKCGLIFKFYFQELDSPVIFVLSFWTYRSQRWPFKTIGNRKLENLVRYFTGILKTSKWRLCYFGSLPIDFSSCAVHGKKQHICSV